MRKIALIALLAAALPLAALTARAGDEAGASKAEIERLVTALGHDDFRTREDASRRLAAIGEAARAALGEAAKSSPSPEVRWRAEQLLRRLDGEQAQPLGGGAKTPDGVTPNGQESTDPLVRIRKLMDEWMKRLSEPSREDPFRMPFGPLTAPRRIDVPGLSLERTGLGAVRLRVKRKNEAGAEVEDLFEGSSLRDILQRNPELENHPGMADLQKKEAEHAWPGFEDWFRRRMPDIRVAPGNGTTFSFSTSQGVQVTQDANGVTVRITERNDDGKPETKEYKAESMEKLLAEHPELKDKVGQFRIHVRAPDFFWPGRSPSGLRRLKPQPVTPSAPAEKALFGLGLLPVEEVLGVHLRLAAGTGALVADVHAGSQAAEMGFQPRDIILSVNGTEVDVDKAVELLGEAAKEKAPLMVELIRAGHRMSLSR